MTAYGVMPAPEDRRTPLSPDDVAAGLARLRAAGMVRLADAIWARYRAATAQAGAEASQDAGDGDGG